MADMEQPDRIFLRDHILSTEIGAFQSERGREQRLRFNLGVDLRDSVAGAEDQVDEILSYDVLTQAVDTALADRRYNLVETLAERIAAEVLAHPRAARIEVAVEKLDRGPGALGVRILRDRARVAATGPAEAAAAAPRVLAHGPGAPLPQGATVILPRPAALVASGPHARRLALLAFDQAAWTLAGQTGLEVAETRTELEAAARADRPVIWAPTRLAIDDAQAGESQDSLSLWIAARLGARHLDVARAAGPLPVAPEGLALQISRIG